MKKILITIFCIFMVALFASVAFASSDVDHIATDNNVNQDTYVSVDVDKNNDFYYDGDYQVVDTSKMNDYVFVSVDLGRDYDFNCNETVINHEPVNKENDNIDIGFFPGPAPTPIPEEINKTELEKFTKSMPKDNNTEFKKLTEELNLKLAIKELMNKNKNITIKDEKTGFYPRPTPTPIPEELPINKKDIGIFLHPTPRPIPEDPLNISKKELNITGFFPHPTPRPIPEELNITGFFPHPTPTPIPEEFNKTASEYPNKISIKDIDTELKKITEELNLKLATKELTNKNKNITINEEKTGFYPRPTPTPIPEEFNKTASEYPNKISIKDIDTELKKLTEELNLKLATKELMNQNEIVPDDESDISEPVAN